MLLLLWEPIFSLSLHPRSDHAASTVTAPVMAATAAEANVRIPLVRTRPVVLPARTVPAPNIIVTLATASTI